MHWAVNVDVPYDTIHRDVTDGRQTDSCLYQSLYNFRLCENE